MPRDAIYDIATTVNPSTAHSVEEMIAASGSPERGAEELRRFMEARAAAGIAVSDEIGPAARIFGMSRALAERLIVNPGWAGEIGRDPFVYAHKPAVIFRREIADAIARDGKTPEGFARALRRYKYREMLRIVCRDMEGSSQERELLVEWSDLADALIDAAWSRARETIAARHGEPLAGDGSPCASAVIGLGKLGGRELNLSSDVDILIIYDTDEGGAKSPSGQSITNHEWYVKLASEATRLISSVTEEGFLFRVDHELRPEGPQGPLANSLDAALRYYESFGRDWERQAMIRARAVAGDLALGKRFVSGLRPFVYRRSIALSDLAHMRELKVRMATKAAAKSPASRPALPFAGFDLKHGEGGIREAEFLVQAIQQLHGGSHPQIRKQNTFDAIDALAAEGLVHPYGADLLRDSYAFLRKAENMVQAADDLQRHAIPSDAGEIASLAARMGFSGVDAVERFTSELSRHARGVGRLFNALFEADYERMELEEALDDNLARATNEEESADSLAWFRLTEGRRLAALDLSGMIALPRLLRRLSLAHGGEEAHGAARQAAPHGRQARLVCDHRHGAPRRIGARLRLRPRPHLPLLRRGRNRRRAKNLQR